MCKRFARLCNGAASLHLMLLKFVLPQARNALDALLRVFKQSGLRDLTQAVGFKAFELFLSFHSGYFEAA